MSKTESVIISLAKRVLTQRLSLDTALRDHVPTLIQKGIPLDDLIDAQLMTVD